MSRPRAATSEAISSFASPLRNASSAAVRADWSRSPCSATALKPWRTSERCSCATSRLRLQKMMAFLKLSAARISAAQRVALVVRLAAGLDQLLRDGRGGGGGLRDFDAHRIVQELLGDALDFRRHGGGEEQRLARERHQLADALDVGDEAHVEHAVGFVDDEQLDAGHQQAAALGMVEQAARRCDQHVDAAHQLAVLVVERNAADDEGDVELVVLAVLVEAFLDLRGEFARRLEDQRARHARAGAALLQHGEHRQHEGGGLAGAGLRDAEHVAAREHVGDGLFLDRGGGRVAGRRRRRREPCRTSRAWKRA